MENRDLNSYLESRHMSHAEVFTYIAEAYITLFDIVVENEDIELSDILKISIPLKTLYGIVASVA